MWLNKDPIGEKGGINLYQFIYNNPANLVDKDGRFVWIPFLIGAFVWGAVMAEEPANAPGPHDPTYSALSPADHAVAGVATAVTAGVFRLGGVGVEAVSSRMSPKPTPNPALRPLMNTQFHPGQDCSEIADMMRKAANGEGDIIHVTPEKRGNLDFFEYGVRTKYDYHDIYIDSHFAYDPNLSSVPMPIDEYMNLMLGLNPGATIKFR